MTDLLKLRRFLDPPPPRAAQCEVCSAPIGEEHSHVVDIPRRRLACACRPCAILFEHPQAGAKFRSVGDRYLKIPQPLDDWPFPVGMAFFIRDSSQGRVIAFYPSPAGATESPFETEAPDTLEPDIEALLISRHRHEAWIVPVDACYNLVGRIRKTWRGFEGGEAKLEVDRFFDSLRETKAA
jgi:hypothetical protein